MTVLLGVLKGADDSYSYIHDKHFISTAMPNMGNEANFNSAANSLIFHSEIICLQSFFTPHVIFTHQMTKTLPFIDL